MLLEKITQDELAEKVIISILKNHKGYMHEDEINKACDEVSRMMIDGLLIELFLQNKLDLSWKDGKLRFRNSTNNLTN